MKLIIPILIILLSQFSLAQTNVVQKEFSHIDSLINRDRLELAQIELDEFFKEIRFWNKNEELFLEGKYRQALIYDRKDQSFIESLKLLYDTRDKAERESLHSLMFRIDLLIALRYEKMSNFKLTKKYLDNALELHKKHKMDQHFSTYCIRMSSYFRFIEQWDSSYYYAKKANAYAKKFENDGDIKDSYILLGNFAMNDENYADALQYNFQLLEYSKKFEGYYRAINYINISKIYRRMGDFDKSLVYNDSGFLFYKQQTSLYKPNFNKSRYELFESMGNIDSAYHYYKNYHIDLQKFQEEEDLLKVKELEEKYQNSKNIEVIKNKNLQMIIIAISLGVIILCSIALYYKNRKIFKQNKIINQQVKELTKTVQQKQVLLSELQHRVKNNLQHVISILEIQKESLDYNSMEEVLRSNQNRIHSLAFLHKKLNVNENVNEVDLPIYIQELAELVKESYHIPSKQIDLQIHSQIEKFSLDHTLPLGLIIVELVSNSMKYAFKNQDIGSIKIEIVKVDNKVIFNYADDGIGFDFNASSCKGLGVEIVKGLIDQLNGILETYSDNGFQFTLSFQI